jgi:hypothetical protein
MRLKPKNSKFPDPLAEASGNAKEVSNNFKISI